MYTSECPHKTTFLTDLCICSISFLLILCLISAEVPHFSPMTLRLPARTRMRFIAGSVETAAVIFKATLPKRTNQCEVFLIDAVKTKPRGVLFALLRSAGKNNSTPFDVKIICTQVQVSRFWLCWSNTANLISIGPQVNSAFGFRRESNTS